MENQKNMKMKNNLKDGKTRNVKNKGLKNNSNNAQKNKNNKHKDVLEKESRKNNNVLKEEVNVNVQEQLDLKENEAKEIINEANEIHKEKTEMSKEMKNKIVNAILVIVGICALFGLVFFASTKRDAKETVNYVEDITASRYFELKQGDVPAVILLASPTCSWCQKYKPVITKVSSDYELPVYYLNTSEMSQDEYDSVYLSSPSISVSGQGLIPTPTTLLVKGGEEVDYIEGYVEYNTVVDFLTSNGVIE